MRIALFVTCLGDVLARLARRFVEVFGEFELVPDAIAFLAELVAHERRPLTLVVLVVTRETP